MAINNVAKYNNGGRFEIEGVVSLSAAGAVNSVTAGLASKTVTGENLSCTKSGTASYDFVLKLASSLDGKPVFQVVELLAASASIVVNVGGGAFGARFKAAPTIDANGNLTFSVITVNAAGAETITSAALLLSFQLVIGTQRMDQVL